MPPDAPQTARSWPMFANQYENLASPYWMHFEPSEFVANLYDPKQPVLAVTITEDPDGEYRGWLYTGTDQITLVQHEKWFSMQFTYGVAAEVDRGRGVIVPVSITAGHLNPSNGAPA
jgi:hypothetical protein